MFRFAASTLPVTLRRLGLVAMAGSVAMLSACGGGDRAKAYQPDRIVSFGDENSAIVSFTSSNFQDASTSPTTLKGLTYTVNSVVMESTLYCGLQAAATACPSDDANVDDTTFAAASVKGFVLTPSLPNQVTLITTGTATISSTPSQAAQKSTVNGFVCTDATIWIQVIAHNFGKGYQTKCPLYGFGGAETYATYGAKVADVAAQVNANVGTLGTGVLVTIMAGQNDILELFAQVQGGRSEGDATTELLTRASSLASVVRQVMATGSKVVLALTPDLGESPWAYNTLSTSDKDILKRMTTAFNNKLYIAELGNSSGRQLAGVGTENYTDPNLRISGIDYTDALCNFAAVTRPDGSTIGGSDPDFKERVKYCNSNTLYSTATTYMWADDTHFSSYAHGQIGLAGANRAYNQF